jgi:hypothetical protein
MQQGLSDVPFRGGPGFGIKLFIRQGLASLNNPQVRPVIMLK